MSGVRRLSLPSSSATLLPPLSPPLSLSPPLRSLSYGRSRHVSVAILVRDLACSPY